jgi:hypothetical protein
MAREPEEIPDRSPMPPEVPAPSVTAERSQDEDTPTMDHVAVPPLTDEDDTEGG